MIFPQPKKEIYYESKYVLKQQIKYASTYEMFCACKNGNEDIKITISSNLENDEYGIEISENGIYITASDECGIFRAFSSLRQIISSDGKSVPYCEIGDCPDFKKRAYMLDISRCRMPKVETITGLIDLLAELKYNEFQLYMESFVFKYEAYPKYTADFDCLTPDDIEYLVGYCRDRFIDLVPNQNSLGHMRDWLAEDEFAHLRVGNETINTGTINPLLPESFEFLDKLYSSLLPHFDSEYVNIGLDEAFGLGRYQLEDICAKQGKDTVFMDWLEKIASHIKEKFGKKVQFWSDMVYEYPDAYKRVPEGAVALNWGYDAIENSLMEKRCMDLEAKGCPYYVCPGNNNWISFTGRFDLMNFNLRCCGEFGKEHGAMGYLLTDWGCGEGHYHFPVWSLVPCALGAQYAWNVGEKQNGENHKRHFIRAAEKYVDDNIFKAPVAKHLHRLQQYYLLEPERVHCMTMCGYMIRFPLSETKGAHFFDLKDCGEDFYFDNVTAYVEKILGELKDVDFDENIKRQIFVNSQMVILSSELCKIRINQKCTKSKADELATMIDAICDEYAILWDRENYPKGKEFFINQLCDRKKELLEMKCL